MDIKEILNRKAGIVEEELKKYVKIEDNAQNKIYDAMGYSLLAGGKRLRPVLALMTCEMCGGDETEVLPFACALEMIHTYSLIHDDLPAMDNDDLRRGKPTNHKVYGEAMAILAGDALLNKAAEAALSAKTKPEKTVKIMQAVFGASGTEGMIGGQVIDIKNAPMSEKELENLHLLKTGALIRAAGKIGAIAADASEQEAQAIDCFCKNLGIAFQICDDILDVQGNEEDLGKPVGSDRENNKTTYVTLFGTEGAKKLLREYTARAEKVLSDCFGEKSSQLLALAELLISRRL